MDSLIHENRSAATSQSMVADRLDTLIDKLIGSDQSSKMVQLSEMDQSLKTESADDESTIVPSLSELPLHEWIAALTHPISGQFPNGVTTRNMLDLVKKMDIRQFPSADRRRYHSVWKSAGHFSVHLSHATRRGLIRRLCIGMYMGIFDNDDFNVQEPALIPIGEIATNKVDQNTKTPVVRSSNKRKLSMPQRHPLAFNATKQICVTAPNPIAESDQSAPFESDMQQDFSKRPSSCDSVIGGSGSSSTTADDFPIEQGGHPKLVIRKTGHGKKLEVVKKFTGKEYQEIAVDESSSEQVAPDKDVFLESADVVPKELELKKGQKSRQKKMTDLKTSPSDTADLDEFGLPSLLKLEPTLKNATWASVSALSIEEVNRLCEKLGFEDGAKALLREEVDGTALLLLTREDVMNNLGLKLGPALKLARFIRAVQECAKNSQ